MNKMWWRNTRVLGHRKESINHGVIGRGPAVPGTVLAGKTDTKNCQTLPE